jgi:hypothetical protein
MKKLDPMEMKSILGGTDDPVTPEEIAAHEAAHVVQQGR